MVNFLKYIRLIVARLFSRIFLLFDLLGVIFYLLTRNIPQIPGYATVLLFALIFFYSSYLVWLDELRRKKELQNELDEIKDSIPKYNLHCINVEKYSVSKLIEHYEKEIEVMDRKLHDDSENDTTKVYGISNFAKSIQQISNTMKIAHNMLGIETPEERRERLTKYLNELKAFEKVLNHLYKTDIVIESSRSDTNIELDITANKKAFFKADDNLLTTYQPRLSRTTNKLHTTISYDYFSHHLPVDMLPNIESPDHDIDYWDKDSMNANIRWINADHRELILNESLFMQFKGNKLKLNVSINSEKLVKTQSATVVISVENIIPIQLEER